MLEAILFGFIAGSALFLGGVLGIYLKLSKKLIATIMAFGAGVLICALSFDLMEEAYNKGGFFSVSFGFLLGALIFILGDYLVSKKGGRYHKKIKKNSSGKKIKEENSGMAIFIGTLLDGIPESVAIGASLTAGKGLGILILIAVFLNNLPESFSASVDMLRAKKSKKFILTLWLLMLTSCTISSLFGYVLIGNNPSSFLAFILSLAAGSILATITDTMVPEAFEEGGKIVAFATVAGFLLTFIISHLTK